MGDSILDHVEVIPARPAHAAWILSTFRAQIAGLPLANRAAVDAQACALERMMRGGLCSTVVAVPRGFDDALMGWASATNGALLFAYVRDEFRLQGIGGHLAAHLVPSVPIPVAYWTPAADGMERHGFPLRYEVRAYLALCQYVRRSHQHERAA